MGGFVSAQLKSGKDMHRVFDQLGKTASKRVLRGALKETARPIRKEIKRNAPVRTGALRRSVKTSTKLRNKSAAARVRRGTVQVFIGPTVPYGHLPETGRVITERTREGGRASRRVIGHVPARPYIAPSFDAKVDEASAVFEEIVWRRIVKVADRWQVQASEGRLSRSARRVLERQK